MWFLEMISGYVICGVIHILLVIAIAVVLISNPEARLHWEEVDPKLERSSFNLAARVKWKVKSKKRAIAIGLSKARERGVKVPQPPQK